MSTPSDKINKDAPTSNATVADTPKTTDTKSMVVPEKVMKLLYQYAEEAILKEIQIGSKAFKNYLRNRLAKNKVSDTNIEMAIQTADYSQLQERYIKDGKLVAKESQKYSLTAHAKERMSKPNRKNITSLFEKYSNEAKERGIRNEKQCLAFLKEKIQPRSIQTESVAVAIDAGKCKKLPGKRLKYTKDGLNVIVSKRDHSIITAFHNRTASSSSNSGSLAAPNKTSVGKNVKK